MKKSTIQKIQNIIKEESQDVHTLIATCDTDDNITVSLQGKSGVIGKVLYAIIHNMEHEDVANELYTMIKNIAYNIINNHSPMADDLVNMFLQTINDNGYAQSERPTIPLITQGEA